MLHLGCSSIPSLSIRILSATDDEEVKLVAEEDAREADIEKLQARAERALLLFLQKTFPGM